MARVVIFMAGFLLVYRTIHSPFGQVLRQSAKRTARAVARYDVNRYKLLAYMLSATLPASPARQGAGVPTRLAHRRALEHVGGSGG